MCKRDEAFLFFFLLLGHNIQNTLNLNRPASGSLCRLGKLGAYLIYVHWTPLAV